MLQHWVQLERDVKHLAHLTEDIDSLIERKLHKSPCVLVEKNVNRFDAQIKSLCIDSINCICFTKLQLLLLLWNLSLLFLTLIIVFSGTFKNRDLIPSTFAELRIASG